MVDPLSYFSFQPKKHKIPSDMGARCSSVVRAFAHGVRWGGPIELFLVAASAPRLVQQRPWYVLSCLWDGAYKRTLAANRKE